MGWVQTTLSSKHFPNFALALSEDAVTSFQNTNVKFQSEKLEPAHARLQSEFNIKMSRRASFGTVFNVVKNEPWIWPVWAACSFCFCGCHLCSEHSKQTSGNDPFKYNKIFQKICLFLCKNPYFGVAWHVFLRLLKTNDRTLFFPWFLVQERN